MARVDLVASPVGECSPLPPNSFCGADVHEHTEFAIDLVEDPALGEFTAALGICRQEHGDEAAVPTEEVKQFAKNCRVNVSSSSFAAAPDVHLALKSSTNSTNGATSASRKSPTFEPK